MLFVKRQSGFEVRQSYNIGHCHCLSTWIISYHFKKKNNKNGQLFSNYVLVASVL